MASDAANLISASAAEVLLRAHDGDCALLYLWYAVSGSRDPEQAALALCMTRLQVDAAAEKLGRMFPSGGYGLSPQSRSGDTAPGIPPVEAASPSSPPAEAKDSGGVVLLPAEELPEYSADEIESFSHTDNGFRAVRDLAEGLLGKQLNRHDLSRLLGMYHHLGLPADVLFVLLHYCAEISRGPSGAERKPTINFIERQAYAWVNQGITTAEEAEEYAERQLSLREDEGRIKRILEIYDRGLTPTEKNNIAAWIGMGFSDDAIALAYERTLDRIGKRYLPYMNTILLRWNEAGLHTAAEVNEKEPAKDSSPHRNGKNGKPPRPFEPTEF